MEPRDAERTTADVVGEAEGRRTHLAESPRWDGEGWWWVDANAGTVWRRVPGEPAELVADRGGRVSLCQPLAGGGAVIVDGLVPRTVGRTSGGGWQVGPAWCHPLAPVGWLVNDGIADPAGRLWIGSIHPDRAAGAGELIMVEPGGAPVVVRDGFSLSNGMAWDPSGSVLWHADSGEQVVWAHRIDVSEGRLVDSTVALRFSEDDGMPDGLASDVEGGLWVALYGVGQVRRYVGGALERVVEVPTPQTTAVEFGGAGGDELLITTAREGFDEERSAVEPLAGRLFSAQVAVRGRPRPVLRRVA